MKLVENKKKSNNNKYEVSSERKKVSFCLSNFDEEKAFFEVKKVIFDQCLNFSFILEDLANLNTQR